MLSRAKWHKSLTDEVILDAAQRQQFDLDNPGFCLVCGLEQEGHEPDARRHVCESCGEAQVYGAEELMFTVADEQRIEGMIARAEDDEHSGGPVRVWPAGRNRDGD